MGTLAALHTLWIGKELSWIEQLCLSSWLAHGHDVTLWIYDPVEGVPDGVKIDNAEKVLRRTSTKPQRTNNMVANRFRYLLLRSREGIVWFDADMLLLQPLDDASPYLFLRETSDLINSAVMRLPSDSPYWSICSNLSSRKSQLYRGGLGRETAPAAAWSRRTRSPS
jgi:hypothetical protein